MSTQAAESARVRHSGPGHRRRINRLGDPQHWSTAVGGWLSKAAVECSLLSMPGWRAISNLRTRPVAGVPRGARLVSRAGSTGGRQWRRRRSCCTFFSVHDLLPSGNIDTPDAIHAFINALDSSIRERHVSRGDRVDNHVFLYRLRAKALDTRLDKHDLGRVLYHLAQRRGFLSNRKTLRTDEDAGEVYRAITELGDDMRAVGARTLGEYFSRLDPEEERIRRRWTSRPMYEDEFNAIWDSQSPHHDTLTGDLKKTLHQALFFQRPLKSQKHLVGHCDLLPKKKRIAIGRALAQEFRVLQAVNNLEIRFPDYTSRSLSPSERRHLITWLNTHGDLPFSRLKQKKHFGLPKGTVFNLEEGGEKRLCGHRTNAKLATVFGARWFEMSQECRDAIIDDVLSVERPETLRRRGVRCWGLTAEEAAALAEVRLEEGYASHCRSALERLLPHLRAGMTYGEARRLEFPERFATRTPLDALPPVLDALPDLRNPAVCRALTELRKLVNAIVRRYGKPERIRIELARELKKGRKHREEATRRNRQNEQRREAAKRRILDELKITNPSRSDIEKVLLAEECNWECPYTTRRVNMATLLGQSPQFDIEHIWPLGRSFDDSYFNKTLCYHEENRARKRNLTPFEAYGNDASQWDAMLERVRRFQGDAAREKARRFLAEDLPDDFTHRQLNDTKYSSRCAGDYVGLLYGGRTDAHGTQRVQVSTGGVTRFLRDEWQLSGILNDGGMKTRDDHRHHAVDAIAIAFAGPRTVKLLADAADRAKSSGRRRFAAIRRPWSTFMEDVRLHIDRVNISFRASRRIAGQLHAESNYSKPISSRNGEGHHIRKELHTLTPTDLKRDQIVDPVIRKIVCQRYHELGGGTPSKAFADPANHPTLRTRSGRQIAIHKVRVRTTVKPRSIGQGPHQRYVGPKAGLEPPHGDNIDSLE